MSDRSSVAEGHPATSGPLLGCDLPLGDPGVIAHNELVLSGWAVSPAGIESVSVTVDERLWRAGYGLDSPWMLEALPAMPGSAHAGFLLRIDCSAFDPGSRTVAVTARDPLGRGTEIRGEVEFLPFEPMGFTPAENTAALAEGRPAMWVERPALAEVAPQLTGEFELSGWAHAEAGIERIVITIDNRLHSLALRPLARPDLVPTYGEEVAAGAGFFLDFGAEDLPPGVHRMGVVAVASDGRAVGVENHVTCRFEAESAEVDWMDESRAVPRRRVEAGGPCSEWEERALRAEADAAASRTEANLAQLHQKGALRMLREAEDRLRDG